MSFGSFLGDGSERGPDYTAQALHQLAVEMASYYEKQPVDEANNHYVAEAVKARVAIELRLNRYDEAKNVIVLNDAQISAWNAIQDYYLESFSASTKRNRIHIPSKQDRIGLSALFFWGAWFVIYL